MVNASWMGEHPVKKSSKIRDRTLFTLLGSGTVENPVKKSTKNRSVAAMDGWAPKDLRKLPLPA